MYTPLLMPINPRRVIYFASVQSLLVPMGKICNDIPTDNRLVICGKFFISCQVVEQFLLGAKRGNAEINESISPLLFFLVYLRVPR